MLSVGFTIVCLKNQDRKTETCLVSYSFDSFSFFYMGVGFKLYPLNSIEILRWDST